MLESVLISSASTAIANKLASPNIDNLFCISVKAKSQSIQSNLHGYDKNQAAFALFRLSVAAMTSIQWQKKVYPKNKPMVRRIDEEIDIDEDKNQDQQAERDMSDIPVELEIRLKKEAKRKRKFKPITSNKRRKDCA
ncbi:hypothetical protein BD560DRAFT_442269 [Blakeslea trispora]|nr:hypothetical protein BD560DRAFT_442269 [Blakeslea trispora]